MVPQLNYLAVFVAAILNMVLGGIWYGPLFGKQWTKMMGFTPEHMKAAQAKGMGKSYAIMAIASLLMSYILARFVIFSEAASGIWDVHVGLKIAVMAWAGFVAPVTVNMVLWEGKPWKLWMIVAGYALAGLCLMGAILAVWT
jgi:hypothetical protein